MVTDGLRSATLRIALEVFLGSRARELRFARARPAFDSRASASRESAPAGAKRRAAAKASAASRGWPSSSSNVRPSVKAASGALESPGMALHHALEPRYGEDWVATQPRHVGGEQQIARFVANRRRALCCHALECATIVSILGELPPRRRLGGSLRCARAERRHGFQYWVARRQSLLFRKLRAARSGSRTRRSCSPAESSRRSPGHVTSTRPRSTRTCTPSIRARP